MKIPTPKPHVSQFLWVPIVIFILLASVFNMILKEVPVVTIRYICAIAIAFVLILRTESFWNFNHGKLFDKVVTPIIWVITISVLLTFFPITLCLVVLLPYFLARINGMIALFSLGVRLKFVGKRPEGRNFIYMLNHSSFVDDVIHVFLMPFNKWKVVFASEVKRIFPAGLFVKFFGIPVNRKDEISRFKVAKIILRYLRKGWSILVYPEGKRLVVQDDSTLEQELLMPFEDGPFKLAIKTETPIVPVVLSWPFLYKPRSGQWWVSPHTITVYYLDPVSTKFEDGEDKPFEYLRDEVRSLILSKLQESLPAKIYFAS